MSQSAIEAVRAALATDPSNASLRLVLVELLAADGLHEEAVTEAARVLAAQPGDERALRLLQASSDTLAHRRQHGAVPGPDADDDFDWEGAEESLGPTIPPPFLDDPPFDGVRSDDEDTAIVEPSGPPAPEGRERPRVTFSDVGGLEDVKQRLSESFIQPMRNTAIARVFGSTARGGLLLYGPPGCGKTFIARAVAGELGAQFMALVMTDIMTPYYGETERNIRDVFEQARGRAGATVLFLDEIDALAHKRSTLVEGASWLRSTVNQLLLELDSMQGNNEGLYVLAATNHPWDLDEAFLRPGRLDRAILVPPPDPGAREEILRRTLQSRPVAGVDLPTLVSGTEGFSGADLTYLSTTAAEAAMSESIASNDVRPVTMDHLSRALTEITPSTAEWFASARTVMRFSRDGGRYDDLRRYLASHPGPEERRPRRGWWS